MSAKRDIEILGRCIKALEGSSNTEMLKANLRYLVDYFVAHPSGQIKETFRMRDEIKRVRAS